MEHFGQVEKYQTEDYGKLTSVRVWYQNGVEVEYGFTTPDWAVPPLDLLSKSCRHAVGAARRTEGALRAGEFIEPTWTGINLLLALEELHLLLMFLRGFE